MTDRSPRLWRLCRLCQTNVSTSWAASPHCPNTLLHRCCCRPNLRMYPFYACSADSGAAPGVCRRDSKSKHCLVACSQNAGKATNTQYTTCVNLDANSLEHSIGKKFLFHPARSPVLLSLLCRSNRGCIPLPLRHCSVQATKIDADKKLATSPDLDLDNLPGILQCLQMKRANVNACHP